MAEKTFIRSNYSTHLPTLQQKILEFL